MKYFFFISLIFMSVCSIYAQVGINTETPANGAYLDIFGNAGGLLPPRMSTQERDTNLNPKNPAEGMLIYNTTESSLQQNISKIATTPEWINIGANQTSTSSVDWFYAPPVAINLTTVTPTDVYGNYKNSFTAASNNLKVYELAELEMYVIGYDTTVFKSVQINSITGILTYTLQNNAANLADSQTYLTVIFKIKE